MEPFPNNTRYLLELERNDLLLKKLIYEETYGTFSFTFITCFQAFALLAYFLTVFAIISHKCHSKINLLIILWSLINSLVLLSTISRGCGAFDSFPAISQLSEMLAALGRSYGTSLSLVWLYHKFIGQEPNHKYDVFIWILILCPALAFTYFIFHYFHGSQFIYEVYGPGSDCIHLLVYLVLFTCLLRKKLRIKPEPDTTYVLLVTLVNFITNFPGSLITILLRFTLDVGWHDKFKIYFVRFCLDIVTWSNAFVVLFLVILYNDSIRYRWLRSKRKFHCEEPAEQATMLTELS